jgi:tetratricopeptide (TPR) repeat protein
MPATAACQTTVAAPRKVRSVARWWAPLALVLITALAFLPVLQAGFLNWDDPATVTDNYNFRGLGPEQIRWAFTTFHMGHYQPLSWLTLSLDYTLWGLDPLGYHLTNLILHIASSLLVYWLALRLLRLTAWRPSFPSASPSKRAGLIAAAFVAACLFAVHPTRVESVAWITERRDVLSTALYLLTIHLYLTACTRTGRGSSAPWLAVAVLVFILALLAKVMSVSLVAALLILDAYPLRRLGGARGWFNARVRNVWLEKIPFLVPALAAAVLAFFAQAQVTSIMPWSRFGLLQRLAVSAYGLVYYIWRLVWPFGLSPLYELPVKVHWFEPRFLFCGALVLAGLGAVILARRRRPGLAAAFTAAAVAYVVILVPVSGLFQNGPQIVADRYSYLACIGWLLLVGAGFGALWRRSSTAGPRAALAASALIVVVGLSSLTWRECKTWQDSMTVWARAVRVDPGCALCQENYGEALYAADRYKESAAAYRRALELYPGMEQALVGLANVLAKQGDQTAALELYERALRVDPNYAGAHYNLAVLLTAQGDTGAAIRHYRLAIEDAPNDVRAYGNLANLLSQSGRLDEAISLYTRALHTRPDAADIQRNLGLALARVGDLTAAEMHLRQALRAKPHDAEVHNNLGVVLEQLGHADQAEQAYRDAIRLDPGYNRARRNLALLLIRTNRTDEALRELQYDPRLSADNATFIAHIADRLVAQDRCAEAVRLIRKGLAAWPGDETLQAAAARAAVRCPADRPPDKTP